MSHLPDPQWCETLPECLQCGYPLQGLASGTPCPECGTATDSRVLILHGVPRRITTGSGSRRVLIVLCIVAVVVMSQFWFVGLILLGRWFAVSFVLACLGAILAMVFNAPGGEGGKSRIVLTCAGIACRPLGKRAASSTTGLHPWTGDDLVKVTRAGPVWANLNVKSSLTGEEVIDAGIRCPEAQLTRVAESIRMLSKPSASIAPAALPAT